MESGGQRERAHTASSAHCRPQQEERCSASPVGGERKYHLSKRRKRFLLALQQQHSPWETEKPANRKSLNFELSVSSSGLFIYNRPLLSLQKSSLLCFSGFTVVHHLTTVSNCISLLFLNKPILLEKYLVICLKLTMYILLIFGVDDHYITLIF